MHNYLLKLKTFQYPIGNSLAIHWDVLLHYCSVVCPLIVSAVRSLCGPISPMIWWKQKYLLKCEVELLWRPRNFESLDEITWPPLPFYIRSTKYCQIWVSPPNWRSFFVINHWKSDYLNIPSYYTGRKKAKWRALTNSFTMKYICFCLQATYFKWIISLLIFF